MISTNDLVLIPFQNIEIWPKYRPKKTKFDAYAHIWAYVFWPYLSHFLSNFEFQKIPELRRKISIR